MEQSLRPFHVGATDVADEARRSPISAPTVPDNGLICGFAIGPAGAREVSLAEAVAAHADGEVVWLHFNSAHTGTRRWLAQSGLVAAAFLEAIEHHESRVRIVSDAGCLVAVVPDLCYGDAVDPSEISTIWACVDARLMVSVRQHAARSTDRLRRLARAGMSVASGQALFLKWLQILAGELVGWTETAGAELDRAEDRILQDDVELPREILGRCRRQAMHLRRHFAPLRAVLQRSLGLIGESPGASADDWRHVAEEISFALDETAGNYERAKLLQEELGTLLAETTSRNLFVLTVATIVFLPMTLITGIFGMNLSGMPGAGDHASTTSFWWVMLLILAAGGITLALIRARRFY